MWFCSTFHTLCSSAKNLESRLRFDKVTESLKVETFFETKRITCMLNQQPTAAQRLWKHSAKSLRLMLAKVTADPRVTYITSRTKLTPSLPVTFSLLKVITNDSASSAGTWPTTRPSSRTENQLCDVIDSRLSSSWGIIPRLHSNWFNGFVSTILFTTYEHACNGHL